MTSQPAHGAAYYHIAARTRPLSRAAQRSLIATLYTEFALEFVLPSESPRTLASHQSTDTAETRWNSTRSVSRTRLLSGSMPVVSSISFKIIP